MGERSIWRIIFWVLVGLGIVMLVLTLDPGFLRGYAGGVVIPVSTGERIEMLVMEGSPSAPEGNAELYWVREGEEPQKVRDLEGAPQCVTSFDGRLFVNWRDGNSTVFEDGQFVRGVGKASFDVIDAAGFGGTVYAFGTSGEKRLAVARLAETGWESPAEPFETDEEFVFAGCVDVEGGVECLLGRGPTDLLGRLDTEKARWSHVLFDGEKWGEPEEFKVPPGMIPAIGSYEEQLAFVLFPAAGEKPITLNVLSDGALEEIATLAVPKEGRIFGAWTQAVAGGYSVILLGGGTIWQVPLEGGKAGRARELLRISRAAAIRSEVYVGLLIVASVLLVALGSAWLYVRVRRLRAGREE